jgi:hypothetical protein
MISIAPDEFDALRARAPLLTGEGLFETYRISQTTWYKLRDGRPVKRDTIERVRARYRDLAGA